VRVVDADFIPLGMSARANGRTFEGPVYIARKSVLGEISFTELGADTHTAALIAANAAGTEGGDTMKFSDWLKTKGFSENDLTDEQKATLKVAFEKETKAGSLRSYRATVKIRR